MAGITAIHWLTPTPQRFVDLPGEWYGHERGAAVTLRRGEILTVGANVLGEGVHVLATCPVPPDANTLPFAVEPGEQLPAMASP